MAKVLQLDCNFGGTGLVTDLGSETADVWATLEVALSANALTWFNSQSFAQLFSTVYDGAESNYIQAAFSKTPSGFEWNDSNTAFGDVADTLASMQFYTVELHCTAGSPVGLQVFIDGTNIGTLTTSITATGFQHYELDSISGGLAPAGSYVYVDNFMVGTTRGGSDLFSDDFEGSLPGGWNETYNASVASIIADPGIAAPAGGPPAPPGPGRVSIAFDDGPLEPNPAWTVIDQGGDFPQNFVSGYDVQSGRQTLLSQTDTGTATVYINDREQALFDPRNVSSPYFGKLDGKQIALQLWDPEASAWEMQFRGLIDDITWDIDGSAVGSDGEPINASIQIDCVDMFDYLAGFGLTPGLDGITPRSVPSGGTAGGPAPAGYENGVYYAQTAGTVDDRIIEILTDVGIDSTRYTVASGNVSVKAVKYDPDESALQALRDAADAEIPFVANIYCDRHGDFLFRGRYSRFAPDDVAAEPGSTWDFTRWAAGDGAAIIADSTRAQLRTFAFGRSRSDLINVAICYPQDMKASQMPNQVKADTSSITAYGKHSAPPMSDLLTNEGSAGGGGFTTTDVQECYLFAKLTVLNQKDPRENIKTLGFKQIQPDGSTRSVQTWALMTRADISHIVNVAVGYPAGTGLAGSSPTDDYYIEGRQLRVRPLNTIHDQVDLELAVSPAVWSMDTHSVFAAFPGP